MSAGVGILEGHDIDADCANCGCRGYRHTPCCGACLDCGGNTCSEGDLPVWPRSVPTGQEAEHG